MTLMGSRPEEVFRIPPRESDMATTRAPSLWRIRATMAPAFPAPWPTTPAPVRLMPTDFEASRMVNWHPRAVASFLPSDPPTERGLPVTTPRQEYPLVML